MIVTNIAHAREQLSIIADLGFCVLVGTNSTDPSEVAKEGVATWNSEHFDHLREQGDSVATWFSEVLGNTPLDDLDPGESAQKLKSLGSVTLISEIHAKIRFGVILNHSSEKLSEVELGEVRAAALILIKNEDRTPEVDLSGKVRTYLEQVSGGASDEEIAQKLNLSLRAIKERKRNVIEELGAKSIGHAIGIAKRAKLI